MYLESSDSNEDPGSEKDGCLDEPDDAPHCCPKRRRVSSAVAWRAWGRRVGKRTLGRAAPAYVRKRGRVRAVHLSCDRIVCE